MIRHAVSFAARKRVDIVEEQVPSPGVGEVLVQTRASLVSPGTEMLVYRGQAPSEMPVDAKLPAFNGERFTYPIKYGYACVGTVVEAGEAVSDDWHDKTVFTFHPHETAFLARPEDLIPLPDDIQEDDALFLPLMETAVNLIQDGAPRLGETVAVTGIGVVGLLTTAILARMPLSGVYALDLYPKRRELALTLGATAVADPADDEAVRALEARIRSHSPGADVTFELSGDPAGFNRAISLTADSGCVVVGSWYGTKPGAFDLGGRFHRSRLHVLSSQVSSIDPKLQGRWTVQRRQQVAWSMIREIRPSLQVLSHRLPIKDAARAYEMMDNSPETTLAIAFDHQVG
ncbi:zinc-binding alcohol dehydrogenase [bacterium]|nr:zinc-binding alcohol dehydrogenase [bacterium]